MSRFSDQQSQSKMQNLLSLTDGAEFIYDPRVGRYRFREGGQFVSGNQFRHLTNLLIKENGKKIHALLGQRFSGQITHEAWRKQTLDLLKQNTLQTFVLHRGGAGRVTTEDLRKISEHLSLQFGHFRNLSAKVNLTVNPSDADIAIARRRLDSYINNTAVVRTIAQQHNSGATHGYRIPGGIEHCPDCARHLAAGILPVDQLIPPGNQCVCGRYCKCRNLLFPSLIEAIEAQKSGNSKGAIAISLGQVGFTPISVNSQKRTVHLSF